jgi:hypothetical protein
VPTGRDEVVRVAVVTAFVPVPVVVSVAVPRVVVPFENVTVPVGGAEAPATVGIVNVRTTGEPKFEVVGFAVSVSADPDAAATVSDVVEEIAPKLPAAGAAAVIVSVPTGRAVVVVVAMHEVGLAAGVPVKVAVPSVDPPLANVTVEVGQVPLIGVTVSVKVTSAPYVSPVAGEAASVPFAVPCVTVSVAVGAGEAAA